MLLLYFQLEFVEAGCDEAGRGCLAGPVFAAAVILPRNFHHDVLNDSKKLCEKDRFDLRSHIEKEAIAFAVSQVNHEEIDRINSLKASFLAMNLAVEKLHIKPEFILVDGNRFTPYPNIPHECISKGDGKYFSIAAASILAKTYRDDFMMKLADEHPIYGWHTNKGYPTIKHREAVINYGFSPYHRRTFRVRDPQLELFEKD